MAVTGSLERIVSIAAAKAAADPARVSVRDGLQAAAELRQRGADERVATLMGMLGQATARPLSKSVAPMGEVVEAEAEVVQEIPSGEAA